MPLLTLAAIKATVVLAAAFLAALALRRASSSVRYFLWSSALATILAIPILSLSVRPLPVTIAAPAAAIAAVEVTPSAPATPAPRPTNWLIPLWLCGAAAVLIRVAIGHVRVQLALRRAHKVPSPADLPGRFELRIGSDTDVPLSYGLFRPVILLPAHSDGWSEDRRNVVLLHELTHIRRLDALWSFVSQLACAAYWFHPLAWLAAARFRQEQERSCDDAVVRAGAARSAYAGHLVALAGSLTSRSALGMAEAKGLEQRIRALLDPHRKRQSLSRRAAVAALSAILLCAIPFAAIRARAQDNAPKASVSGTVRDPSGAVVPRARVLLKNENGRNQETTPANAAGAYGFQSIPAGTYEVEASAPGFAKYQQQGVELTGSASLEVNLQVGAVSETLEVVGKGPAPAPRAATTPVRIRVGGNVQATRLLKQTRPVYPADAQAAGIEGTVLLRAIISKDGTLLNLSSISQSADPELVQAAIDAAKQWRYQPTLLNGQPVEVITTITVNFRLEH